MPLPHTLAQPDGISVIGQGMHGGISPRLLLPDQLALAINVTCRGGYPRTRPVFRKVPLEYEDEDTRINAQTKMFQRAGFYRSFGQGENVLLAQIGGRTFRYLVGSNNQVEDISITDPADDFNSALLERAWYWQAEDFGIIADGVSRPLFWDGGSLRRSRGQSGAELPVCCMGMYVQGRNWFVLPDRRSFMAGDLVYSHGTGDGYGGRLAVLKTEDNGLYLNGAAFAVPLNAGPINALATAAILDTSLGQGPLVMMTDQSVFSIQVPLDAADWEQTSFPLMAIGLPNYGGLSQESTVPINGDVWYRSIDGLRSYQVGRRDMGTWVNTPLSTEVNQLLAFDTQHFLGWSSGVVFDNRLLMTTAARRVVNHGIVHYGLIALDFNNISSLTARSNPDYDGLWTGLRTLQILKGTFSNTDRCFVFALDPDDEIVLYELSLDNQPQRWYFDNDGAVDVPVESVIVSRTLHNVQRSPWQLKKLYTGDLNVTKLAGTGDNNVNFVFQYRSDDTPGWIDWHNFSVCAPVKQCEIDECGPPADVSPQYRTYVSLPEPDDDCNPITRRLNRTGYDFQVRMQWTGHAQLQHFLVWAIPMTDSKITGCPTSETCQVLEGCEPTMFSYSIES